MTMQEMAALWPNDITDFSKGKATYAAQTLTVARIGDYPERMTIKFREDTTPETRDGKDYTGVWWTVEGEWDNEANRSTKYAGPIPSEGQQISVTLAAKARNNGGYFRDCKISTEDRFDNDNQRVETLVQPPAGPGEADYDDPLGPGPQPTEPAAVPFDPDAIRRASIEKQSFYDHFNPDAVLMLEPERQAALLEAYFETALELISESARVIGLQAMQDILEPEDA